MSSLSRIRSSAFNQLGALRPVRAHLRELMWITIGNVVALIATAMGVRVLTTELREADYGRLALGLTVTLFVSQVLYGPLTVSVSRFAAPYLEQGRLPELLGTTYRLLRWITAGAVLFALLVIGVVSSTAGADWGVLLLGTTTFALLQGMGLFYSQIQTAFRHRARAALQQVLLALVRLGFGGGAAILVAPTAPAVALGIALGSALVLISQMASLRSALGSAGRAGRPSEEMRHQLINYGKWLLVFGLFTSLQLSSDVWALKIFTDDASVGRYALAFLFASSTVSLAGAALSQFAFPIAFDRAGLATDPERVRLAIRIVRQASMAMALIAAIGSIASAFVAEPLTLFLSTEAYRDAARYVPWLVLGLGLAQVGNLLALVPMALNQMRSYAMIKIELAVFGVATNLLGAWQFGTLGVAYSIVLASVVYVILVLHLSGQLASKHLVAAAS